MDLPAPLDHLVNAEVRRFAAYWLNKRGGRPIPRYKDLDPVEIPWALANLWICDYLPEGRTFRYRLVGEVFQVFFGRSFRGRMLQEVIPAAAYPPILERYRTVVERPAIAHNIGRIYIEQDRHIDGERLILPLAAAGETATMLVGFTVLDNAIGTGQGAWRDSKLATTFVSTADLTGA